jgi:uracil phosphoribosyltransferase
MDDAACQPRELISARAAAKMRCRAAPASGSSSTAPPRAELLTSGVRIARAFENHNQTLGVLRHERRAPSGPTSLIQEVGQGILIVVHVPGQAQDDGLIFFHAGENSTFCAMHTTPEFPTLRVVDHPLVQHKLSFLRDRTTPTKIFKELVDEIATLMAYEATSDLVLEPVPVETPLERTIGYQVSGKKLTLVPILRAGLGMVEGIARLVPSARVGHIGLYRDHDTLEPVDYYFKVPSDTAERDFLVLDPMLATGGSAVAAITSLKRAKVERIRLLCIVAAPEGVRRMATAHPDVQVFCAALDRELNAQGYILPGLGDAGDRLFGTR